MPNIALKLFSMPSKKASEKADETFENLQLKKRIAELEKQLKDAELKAIAFSTMVDIAEKEFKIPLRRTCNPLSISTAALRRTLVRCFCAV
jgi:cell division septum initiation protein DivIVA